MRNPVLLAKRESISYAVDEALGILNACGRFPPALSRWDAKQQRHGRRRERRIELARTLARHSGIEWVWLMTLCNRRCLCCGSRAEITKDHIRPISRGGSDSIMNLQPLCRHCNNVKATSEVDYRSETIRAAIIAALREA